MFEHKNNKNKAEHSATDKPKEEKSVILTGEEHKALIEEATSAKEYKDKLLRLQAEFDNAKKRLEKEEYEVIAAYDGREGYEKALKEKPDLVILDLIMPKMDGYKTCSMLKTSKECGNTPVIMLTMRGKGLDLERIVAEEVGADAYITKPFEPRILLAKIRELLKR